MHLKTFVAAVFLALLTACATHTPQQSASAASDRNAGQWRTWVLASGQELRLPPPPDAAATAAELQQLRTFVSQRDSQMQQRFGTGTSGRRAPLERYVYDIRARIYSRGGAMRTFAMLNVALTTRCRGVDTKYAYTRGGP